MRVVHQIVCTACYACNMIHPILPVRFQTRFKQRIKLYIKLFFIQNSGSVKTCYRHNYQIFVYLVKVKAPLHKETFNLLASWLQIINHVSPVFLKFQALYERSKIYDSNCPQHQHISKAQTISSIISSESYRLSIVKKK